MKKLSLISLGAALILLAGDGFCVNRDAASNSNQRYSNDKNFSNELSKNSQGNPERMERTVKCPYCKGTKGVIKQAIPYGEQRYSCKDCKRNFSLRKDKAYDLNCTNKYSGYPNFAAWKYLESTIDSNLPAPNKCNLLSFDRYERSYKKYVNILSFYKYKLDEYEKKMTELIQNNPKPLRGTAEEFEQNEVRKYVREYFNFISKDMNALFAKIIGKAINRRMAAKITREDYEQIVPRNIEGEVNDKLSKYKKYCEDNHIDTYAKMKGDFKLEEIVRYLDEVGFSYTRIIELLGLKEDFDFKRKMQNTDQVNDNTRRNNAISESSRKNNSFDIENLLADELPNISLNREHSSTSEQSLVDNNSAEQISDDASHLRLLANVVSGQEYLSDSGQVLPNNNSTKMPINDGFADNKVSTYLGKRSRSVTDEGDEVLHLRKKRRKISGPAIRDETEKNRNISENHTIKKQ